jgi:hypothetical protein
MNKLVPLLVFLPAAVLAQLPMAELAGHVADQSQASIPGERITLRNTATSVERTAETNGEGYYIQRSLYQEIHPSAFAIQQSCGIAFGRVRNCSSL